MAAPQDLDVTALAAALARVLGAGTRGVVESARRVTGGASRETWLFDALDPTGGHHRLVLRRDPTVAPRAPGEPGQAARTIEYQLLAAAGRSGVAVPPLVLLLEPGDGLGDGFVMGRVDGETIPRRILRDDAYVQARPALAGQLGAMAACIHRVPVASLPGLATADGPAQLRQWRTVLHGFGEPHPAFELGLRWLAEHPHAPGGCVAPRLVHGDFRLGNLVVGPEGLRAVLDWELAHLGDPAEDLGWLCVRAWRFGSPRDVVGGFGTVDDLLGAYEAAGGAPIDPATLRWWVALGTLKWGVMCIAQAFTHLAGHVRSVELAAIGRRVSETEHDLLLLMDGGW